MTSNKPIDINGHILTRTGKVLNMGSARMLHEWQCAGCKARTDVGGFSVGSPCKGDSK